MKKNYLNVFIFLLISINTINLNCEEISEEAFSFTELENTSAVESPELQYLKSCDGINLAYHEYFPEQVDAVLVFYHGGGAYSEAGYQHLGSGLSKQHNILVVTPDIRGHGDSEGRKGDTPNVHQVYEDITSFIQLMKQKYPDKKLFLGGHSSGAGLVLNYSNWKKNEEVSGYLFISPHLGFRSNTQKKENNFAIVKEDLFVSNSISGTEGNSYAVFFNYPKAVLQSTKNIDSITVNMANAITPLDPAKQIEMLDRPAAVWIGAEDEVFMVDKVISIFTKNNPSVYTEIIENEKHLSILVNISDYLGEWLQNELKRY